MHMLPHWILCYDTRLLNCYFFWPDLETSVSGLASSDPRMAGYKYMSYKLAMRHWHDHLEMDHMTWLGQVYEAGLRSLHQPCQAVYTEDSSTLRTLKTAPWPHNERQSICNIDIIFSCSQGLASHAKLCMIWLGSLWPVETHCLDRANNQLGNQVLSCHT